MSDNVTEIGALRAKIDGVDDAIVDLLNERATLAKEIGALKASDEGDRSFYAPQRERDIVARLQGRARGAFPPEAIAPVFQEIISACLRLQAHLRVAYLGPEGTFTHQALTRHFGTSAHAIPCGSIASVFASVQRGEAQYGVVPIENSSQGVVHHTLDSFLESKLSIRAEVLINIEHCLLVPTGVELRHIDRVYSHPQALSQCRGWLQTNLSKAATVETASTTEAAKEAGKDQRSAAIGGFMLGRLYGLKVLREQIQDAADNVTRFLVIGSDDVGEPATDGADKTAITLVLPDAPGALFEVLQPMSEAGVNLTRIESRPSQKKAWDYAFFVEFDGHCKTEPIASVLKQVEERTTFFRVLGSYRKARPL